MDFSEIWFKLRTEVSATVLTDLIDVALHLFIGAQSFCKEERIYIHILLDLILTFTIIYKLQDIGGVLRGFYILITSRAHF